MRELKDYTLREWFRIKPIDHFMIEVANEFLQSIFCKLRPKPLERFLQNAEHLSGNDIGLVIAFERPWVLDLLLRTAVRNLTGGTLLVFDNSRRQEVRKDIASVCHERGVPYLALPSNPTKHPNRSHGMAMTWIFHNVVKAIMPKTFTFLDHDLIPMEKIGLGTSLGNQPFYGAIKSGKWGWWTLWAGYCCYDFSAVQHLKLNFLNDFSRDLDTGGRNWPLLYQSCDRNQMRFAPRARFDFIDPLDYSNSGYRAGIVDEHWIHLGGAGHKNTKFKEGQDFYQRISKAILDGASLQELIYK